MQKIMKSIILLLFLSSLVLALISCNEDPMKTIEVFHKNKKPSLNTLEKVNMVLDNYKDDYNISYHVITDSTTMNLINKYNLPDTNFPFAIVINGKFSATIGNKKIDFVHFPLFMHGIRRHEGNWSLDNLETVLKDYRLLINENILPDLEHDEGDNEPCSE